MNPAQAFAAGASAAPGAVDYDRAARAERLVAERAAAAAASEAAGLAPGFIPGPGFVPGQQQAAREEPPPPPPAETAPVVDATPEDIDARTRRLGANVTSIGCAFGVWAPHAEVMTLLIYGGAPDPLRGIDPDAPLPPPTRYPMHRDDSGNWRIEVQQVGGGWRYAFEVTMPGGHAFTRRDPWARETDFESDVCTVVDPGQFATKPFERPKHEDLVMYQCHVGTFTGRGDPELGTDPGTFVALERKLDYIKDLGFNCLQLLPHTEFGGAWGYNPRLMHAVHGPYGDSWDFHELVEAAHERGICVMVDVALHHGAANGNSLWEFDGWSGEGDGGIYFERAGDTGWGQGFAFWKAEVQEYLAATMDTWLGEYNCDGVRIDSAHSMPPDFVRKVTGRAKERYPDRFVIVEHSPEGPHVPGELGADACWLFSSCEDCAGMTNYWKGHGPSRVDGSFAARVRLQQSVRAFSMGSHDTIGKRPGHTHDLGYWSVVRRSIGVARARLRSPVVVRRSRGTGHPMMFQGTETHRDGHWHTTEESSMDWSLITRGGERSPRRAWRASRRRTRSPRAPGASTRISKTLHKDHENGVLAVERHDQETGEGSSSSSTTATASGTRRAPTRSTSGTGGKRRGFESLQLAGRAFGGWAKSGNAERGVVEQDGDMLPCHPQTRPHHPQAEETRRRDPDACSRNSPQISRVHRRAVVWEGERGANETERLVGRVVDYC